MTLKSTIKQIKSENPKTRIIAVEQDEKSSNYKKLKYLKNENITFVFGNEVTGLSKKDLSLCDQIIEIPMKGKKESLNVAVSVGVVLFSLS